MSKKIIITKKPNKKLTKTQNPNQKISIPETKKLNHHISPPTPNINKLNLLKIITYLTIILYFILHVNVIYYQNQIPWLTTGINNFIDLIKTIFSGGNK
ncbi:hypothetical protein LFWB_7160 [Candidatus Phytoplasma luffae]|uniref:Uncharacterized protein n=1 Tax=Loofah witches'-broom phytoplasma TaxID=35773 RepID=A0A975FL51_LOWBP|nr:hypothetical protein [Candidatus Phytoplasma luffae]QTX02601.1 hypothetical protein LFWB_0310 [Candidatus Phytoplasma luffae]QTX02629.1 hypothetical protein LFWB_0590 [Candidatus Phytoplasma luffae]QTX02726.1 hypothetical protein LFWB_1560 [Candidatus Phytoplasma luffae]QTX02867.1 hypothetical protein LFWB_2970 [Candidatus Phytoplasma luffae]QTX02908.1 hypothetical protein LFWB_3380 [Candidatus Phytoplasma luffae]